MTNKRNTKRALLSSVLALVVCVAMLVGSTFAWFTDNASTAVNQIVAGNLDIALEMWDANAQGGQGDWVDAENKTLGWVAKDGRAQDEILWEPGCTYELPKLRIINKGNLALKYQVLVTGIVGDAELLKVIDFTGIPQGDTYVSLLPGKSNEFVIKGHMDENAGNQYKNLQINNISITVKAIQLDYENDSYGPDYDKGLEIAENGTSRVLADGSTVFYYNKDSGLEGRVRLTALPTNLGNEYVVPSVVNDLGGALAGVTLDKLTVPAGIKYAYKSLQGATINEVVIEDGATVIPNRLFYRANIKNVEIPESVTIVEENAFSGATTETLVIPASVTTVEEAAFQDMNSLTTVTFEGNTAIQGYAFRGCDILKTVYLYGDDVTFIPSTLNGRNSCWFCNGESNNPNTSDIDFYVMNDTVAQRVKTAMGAEAGNTDVYLIDTITTTAELNNQIANAPASGETVLFLDEGTYSGDLDLTVAALGASKSDLVFKAVGGEEVILSGTVTLGYRKQGTGAAMMNADVTFEGITFDHANAASHSLDVQDVNSLTLKNCTIIGDGEYGITSANGNATGNSSIIDCTFINAGMQIKGNFGTGLVIDGCTFNNSRVNVQGGNGVTVQNCTFTDTLTDANNNESFYLIRSNSTPITVNNCKFAIDSTLNGVGVAGSKGWGVFVNRGTTNWTVNNIEVVMTEKALAQSALKIATCTSTGKINMSNVTLNGVAQ